MGRAPEAAVDGPPAPRPLEVLLIEDNPGDTRLVAELLREVNGASFALRTARRLAEGLEALDQRTADVVLLDLTLPDAQGLAALDAALVRARDTPILVVTGLQDWEVAVAAAMRGAEDFLVKGELTGRGLARAIRYAVERQRTEKALATSRTRMEALFEHATVALLVADDEGRFLDANPAAEGLLGHPRKRLRTMRIPEILVGGDEEWESRWAGFLGAGRQEGQIQVRRADGGVAEVAYRAVANFVPGEHLSILRDVTERVQAEQQLRRSEERYRRFFEEDLTGDFVATSEGRIVACNPAFAAMFDFPSVSAAVGSNLKTIFPDASERRSFLRHLQAGRKLERVELKAQRRDGQPVHVVANAVGDYDDSGRLVEFHSYLFDTTEQRQAAERLRLASRMEAVGQLAGGIAHDFNNLTTVVTGYSELLLAGLPADDPRRREVREIHRAGVRAAELTSQLLAFSRRQVLKPREIDLNAIVLEVESMLRRVIGEDIELSTVLAPDVGRVRADPGQLHQVILNLVVNARDAMPDGGYVLIETGNVDLDEHYRENHEVVEPGPYVMLVVTDTGIGMDKETRQRVFEPFFTTKEPGKGTGLGLSTVYGVVKQSGGYIWAYSEPGQGTTFKIYLPRVEPATNKDGPRARPVPARRGTETILVVEDSDPVRRLVGEILRPRGYTVIEAATGREAYAICTEGERRIDLVLSDVVMPDIRGPELGRQLAAVRPDLHFLYMSGYAGNAFVRQGSLPPEVPFIAKPFGAAELSAKVREVLDGAPPAVPDAGGGT